MSIIPKNYRRNKLTKLLYLYKVGYITLDNYMRCHDMLCNPKLRVFKEHGYKIHAKNRKEKNNIINLIENY